MLSPLTGVTYNQKFTSSDKIYVHQSKQSYVHRQSTAIYIISALRQYLLGLDSI